MSEPAALRCARCGTAVQPDQEYCLGCGERLRARPGAVERGAAGGARRRHVWAGAWIIPALVALAVAALGTGAAIAISGNSAAPSAVSVATGGNLTVTASEPALTAPEPAAGGATSKSPTTPARAARPPANPATVTWPRGRRGWTIVLVSLPQSAGRAAAADKAAEARRGGLRRVGVLDSSRFASLHPGYYVVFHGVFDSEVEAVSAVQRARAVVSGAYTREIVP